MPAISDLGVLLFQVFLDFAFQSLILNLQVSHPLQVGSQAVIQAFHGLLLTLDAPPHPIMPIRSPVIPTNRALDLPLPCTLVE